MFTLLSLTIVQLSACVMLSGTEGEGDGGIVVRGDVVYDMGWMDARRQGTPGRQEVFTVWMTCNIEFVGMRLASLASTARPQPFPRFSQNRFTATSCGHSGTTSSPFP